MTSSLSIRTATPTDVPVLFDLIKALAAYEKLTHLVGGSTAELEKHLFGKPSYAEAILAEWQSVAVGYALFFPNYSTFLTKPGIYLEDIFVLPDYRRRGIGKALLQRVAQIAVERDAGRLEWSVLDWNTSAIEFYQSLGASLLPEWRICRVTKQALTQIVANL